MQKIKEKTGLALGAITALLMSSLVVIGVSPAQASETAAVIYPTGVGASTQNSMLHTERIELRLRYGTGVVGADNTDARSASGTVQNASIHYVINSASANLEIWYDGRVNAPKPTHVAGNAVSISSTAANDGYYQVPSTSAYLSFGITGMTSLSPAVSVTITPFLDLDGTPGLSNGDSQGAAYTINFVPWSALGATLSLEDAVAFDRGITTSVTVTEGTIRWAQLDGRFGVALFDTAAANHSVSADASGVATPSPTVKSGAQLQSDNFSFSAAALTEPLTTSPEVQSVSARLIYFASASGAVATAVAITAALQEGALTATISKAVEARSVAGVTISPVAGDNIKRSGANAADARFNSAFVVSAFAHTNSITTSMAVATTVTVSQVASDMEFGATAGVILNGTTYTSAATLLAASFTLPAGTTTFAMSTFGQDADGANDNVKLTVKSQMFSSDLTITLKEPSLTPVYVPTTVTGLAGATKSFVVSVEDQWGAAPVRTDLRIKAVVALASSTSTAYSGTVTGGKATVAVAPSPDTRTGSATLTLTLQTFNQSTQKYDDGNTDSVAWNVYKYAAGTDAFSSRTATASASISYGVAGYSWSGVVNAKIVNSFSNVVVSAPGLVIENNDLTTQTASDTLTIEANGQNVNVRFAAKIAGAYTVTFTTGTAATTSVITIDAAGHDKGASISFDKSSIASGETSTITGTLVDANGNPVATGGTASIAVTYTGKGLPYGNSSTMQTDADGKFTFQVLVLSTEKGDAAITAVYKPTGSASSTRNVTTVHGLTVGAAASADQKVNAGSFKGYVAVYAKGYAGQRLSAKVGKDWMVVESLASNFERVVEFTGAGYTIAVRIYIDRVLVDTITVTTK